MNATAHASPVPATSMKAIDRWLRQGLIDRLAHLRHGRVVLKDAMGEVILGSAHEGSTDRVVHLSVNDPHFYRNLAFHGSVGAGEGYMHGTWTCDDLVGLVRLLVRNRELLDAMETGLARFGSALMRGWHALRRNTLAGSRRNIAAHYDLGNAFFALFLSTDLMYSSALWHDKDDTLDAASERKLQTICDKLALKPSDRVIEIGTGWGGFALYAAEHYGCHVTTTTISREQCALARDRVVAAGLQDHVTVLLEDYRQLAGQYDKLVSIEMIEAIGADYLHPYFAQVGRLLKPDGLAVLQAITIEDHRYRRALKSVDFIKRHVFPGSFIPSVTAILNAATHASDLTLIGMQDFGDSYARTLHAWRQRFLSSLHEVRRQGFDEAFIRLWEFYLAYCEGGFRERSIGVAHVTLAKPGYRYERGDGV